MKSGLTTKTTVVGTAALLIIAITLWLSNQSISQLSDDISLSKNMSRLEQLVALLKEQSTQYGANAPRDYESYNRDLKVYYSQLQDNLKSINQMVSQTAHDFYNRSSTTDFLMDQSLLETNQQAFHAMEQKLAAFNNGFAEQMGDDQQAPRLEWGNRFILTDASGLFAQIAMTHELFESLVTAQKQATVNFNWLIMALIALILVAMLAWLNHSVVRRIVRVARACREVALGNYGLRLSDQHDDEIGQLVSDFNQLSNRSKSILTLLDQLHKAADKQQAMNTIRNETQDIVNNTNVYFLSPKKDSYAVQLIASTQSQQGLLGKALLPADTTLEGLEHQEHNLIDDVLAHTIKEPNSHFAKYLLNQVDARSLLVFRIKLQHQTGLLLFTRNSKNGFADSQVQTLKSLGPLFAKSLL
jgi:nitrate/nitrite-specific signal transduction histidine kinase